MQESIRIRHQADAGGVAGSLPEESDRPVVEAHSEQ